MSCEILEEKHAPYPGQGQHRRGRASSLRIRTTSADIRPFSDFTWGLARVRAIPQDQGALLQFCAAEELLARVFGGIDTLKTREGRPLVVDAGPGTPLDHLFRARVFPGGRRA